jgi:hypothetical protein
MKARFSCIWPYGHMTKVAAIGNPMYSNIEERFPKAK